MKILFVCPYLPTAIKRRPLNFVRHLARRHELHLRVVAPSGEIRSSGATPLVEQLRAACASLELLPVSLPRLLAAGAWHCARGEALRTAYTHAHDGFVGQLNRESDALGIDVVHVDRLRLARLAAGIRRPVVLDLPDCMSWAAEQRAAVARGARALFYSVEARRLRSFEGGTLNAVPMALAASDEDSRRVRAAGYRGLTTHVSGIIDLDEAEDGDGCESLPYPALVFHGTLSFPPNVDAITTFAHRIFPLLRARFRDLGLYVVGAAPSKAVRALSALEGVYVAADVERIGPWLRAATAVIAPMRIAGGHSQKVCEALLLGRPVLCSPHAAECVAPEVRPSLLVADDAQEWAQHVERVLDDRAGIATLAERGAQAVARLHAADAVLPVLFDAYRRSGTFPAAA